MKVLHFLLPKKRTAAIFTMVMLLPVLLLAQRTGTKDVTGKVTDKSGNDLSGITVSVRSTTIATVTNASGIYTIKAREGDILVFSSASFTAQQIKVTSASSYNIVMEASVTTLSDVVVVGYGRSSRKNLSSSITTIKPEELNKGAIGDVGQLLQGKVAGLNISASGDPNRAAAVILRGASTINSPSAPFYVIDGVPGADISLIAPDDIASIDVLKDAAATAIYGNRATSGVIIITTKRGSKGQLQTNYNGYVGLEKVSSNLSLMNSSQIRAYLAANNKSFLPADDLGANTDWMKAIERSSAVSQNHNLSFSGGGEHTNYSASINYLDKEGILTNSGLKRFIARLSLEQYALNNKVKFGLNVSNSRSDASYVPIQNIVLLQAAHHLPVSPVKNADGTYFENFNTTGYFNPVALIDHATDETKYNNLIGIFTTEVKLPFGFTYNVNLSYQQLSSLHGEFYDSYYSNYPTSNFYNNPDPGIGISHTLIGNLFGTNGSALRSSYQNTTKTIESYLTWDKKLGDHSINAVVGYSWQDNVYGDGFQTSSTNFPADNVGFNNLALGNPYALSSYRVQFGPDGVYGQTRLISDFGRVNYGYKNKYLLQGSLRRDGGSVFGTNNQWGYFPSVGAAWRISQEGFMQNQSFINELKLRGSYGVTGNSQGFGAYTAQFLYGSTGTYYSNGVQAGAYGPIQGANPDLKWEKTATTNIGADFTILNGKLSGSFDWYDKSTTGMIFNYSVSSAIVPGGKIWANGGSMTNKGIELNLNATPLRTKDFSWNTSLNLAHNKNLITSLTNPYGNGDSILYSDPEGPGQTNSTLQILKVGKPLGQFFSLQYAGKDQNGNSQFLKHDGTLTTAPVIGADYWYVGNAQPKLLAGWSNTFRYKNFDLNIFIRGVFGNKIFDATRADEFYVSGAATNNISPDAANDKITDVRNSTYSTRFIESGNYVRFDNATLAYTFNIKGNYVHSVRVYSSVNNLFVITKYKGVDPEINQGGAAPGIDFQNFYPKTRTILFGVNVSF
ncbi:SusC/RagA family TonB-linked outer membrane protein [Ginsengibacter hankyongi]|uniref:SusC/RagA family TonB-linked outer membrane protein n=1 Tax=Ginsengibacter hankyongi TaxID=2607284 RepID=A0A5J5INV6_9BACT|nr:SusC/RagA family TonB-linked outer membrane protein [Ginsengibacter hankyongi]KAA9041182.1 SusC/RagA family TonB-linked outer membrane protein [Ginsengibacter hankyongi]